MTRTMWTSAPVGVHGRQRGDMRPYPGVVVRPARSASRFRGTSPQDDATTFGIRPPGRPQS